MEIMPIVVEHGRFLTVLLCHIGLPILKRYLSPDGFCAVTSVFIQSRIKEWYKKKKAVTKGVVGYMFLNYVVLEQRV